MSRRVPEIAAFLVESPRLAGASAEEIASAVFRRWPHSTGDEIELAVSVAYEILGARQAPVRTDIQRLIERARLFHGAQVAAELLVKYRPSSPALAA